MFQSCQNLWIAASKFAKKLFGKLLQAKYFNFSLSPPPQTTTTTTTTTLTSSSNNNI